jgi:ABC-type transport system involved in multi-copper enzyme maturation permease subunit
MAILIGTGLVYKEIEKRTIFTLLSKPLRRHEFLLGKFFGLVLTLAVLLAAMSAIFLLLVLAHTGTLQWSLLLAVVYIFLELVLITAVAILFSSFSTPILSSLFALAFYLIGHFSWSLETLLKKLPAGATRTFLRFVYAILPDLENFNIRSEVVHQLPIAGAHLLYSAAYGTVYAAFILGLAIVIFRRRDFI